MRIKEGQKLETKDGAVVDAVEEMTRFGRIVIGTAIYLYCNEVDKVNEVMRHARCQNGELIESVAADIVDEVESCEDEYYGTGLLSKWEAGDKNKTARWERVSGANSATYDFRCSACRRFRFHNGEMREKYKYCPNCGAKMEESNE